jgi:hypothetical protein
VEAHGREPVEGDLVFFDAPGPEELRSQAVEIMQRAGIDPALIYAYRKTGLMVTEDNKSLLSERDLAEWNAAIDEYDSGY